MEGRRRRRPAEPLSQEAILQEAAAHFRQKGYRGTNLQDVADRFGVSRQALYHYFCSKQEILIQLQQMAARYIYERAGHIWDMPLPVAEKLRRLLENHAYGIASNARVIGIFFEEEKELPPHVVEAVIRARRQYNERFIELYRQGVAEGVFADRDPAVAVATLLGACNWCYRWFDPDGRLSAREVAALVAETLMQGVLVRPPAPVTHQAGVPAEPQGRPPST